MGGRGGMSGLSGGGLGGLTMADSDVTRGYVNSTNGRVINQTLRDNFKLSEANAEIVERMDAAMEKTKAPMTLYREFSLFDVERVFGINPKENSFDALKESAVGAEFTDKGYMSTYHSPTGNKYGSAKMQISAKSGTDALLSSNTAENEVILGRNQKWKVTDVTRENGTIVFKVTNA